MMFFFFNDTATTEIYTLSLHDALPIWGRQDAAGPGNSGPAVPGSRAAVSRADRKSTRLNSSHQIISYAVFCLKKKKGILMHTSLAITSAGLTLGLRECEFQTYTMITRA